MRVLFYINNNKFIRKKIFLGNQFKFLFSLKIGANQLEL
jgi:hypothetical protein